MAQGPCCTPPPPPKICCACCPPKCVPKICQCPNYIRGRFTGPARIKFTLRGRKSHKRGDDKESTCSDQSSSSSSSDESLPVDSTSDKGSEVRSSSPGGVSPKQQQQVQKSSSTSSSKPPSREVSQRPKKHKHKHRKAPRGGLPPLPGMTICMPPMSSQQPCAPCRLPQMPMICWPQCPPPCTVSGVASLTSLPTGYHMQAAFPPC